jgi:hypothetical protein
MNYDDVSILNMSSKTEPITKPQLYFISFKIEKLRF